MIATKFRWRAAIVAGASVMVSGTLLVAGLDDVESTGARPANIAPSSAEENDVPPSDSPAPQTSTPVTGGAIATVVTYVRPGEGRR